MRRGLGLEPDDFLGNTEFLQDPTADAKEMGARHQKRTLKILESQIDRLYDNRTKEMRYIFIIIMGSNIYYMIRTPLIDTVISKVMLSLYWILTLFSLFFMSLSYIKNDLRYIRPSYAILAVSNILGIYNFEGK